MSDFEYTVENLPLGYIVLPEGVRCESCGRAWRVPGLVLSDENYNYLVAHKDMHRREIRKPLPRQNDD